MSENIEDGGTESNKVECLSELSDEVVQQARFDAEELQQIQTANEGELDDSFEKGGNKKNNTSILKEIMEEDKQSEAESEIFGADSEIFGDNISVRMPVSGPVPPKDGSPKARDAQTTSKPDAE